MIARTWRCQTPTATTFHRQASDTVNGRAARLVLPATMIVCAVEYRGATVSEPVERARPRAEAARALRAIRELPDTYRETLIMRLVEGLSGPEIAERTGMTPDSVRVHLHRGMKLLRERLGGVP